MPSSSPRWRTGGPGAPLLKRLPGDSSDDEESPPRKRLFQDFPGEPRGVTYDIPVIPYKDMHLEHLSSHPEDIIWMEKIADRVDDEDGTDSISVIWKAKIPSSDGSEDRVVALKIYKYTPPSYSDYLVINHDRWAPRPFTREMDMYSTVAADEEAREANLVVPILGWFELSPAHKGRMIDGVSVSFEDISGGQTESKMKVIVKEFVESREWLGQKHVNFELVPPSRMRWHRSILDRLGIYDTYHTRHSFLNGRLLDLSSMVVKEHIELPDRARLDVSIMMRELYLTVFNALTTGVNGDGLIFSRFPVAEVEAMFDRAEALERIEATEGCWEAFVGELLDLHTKHYRPAGPPGGAIRM